MHSWSWKTGVEKKWHHITSHSSLILLGLGLGLDFPPYLLQWNFSCRGFSSVFVYWVTNLTEKKCSANNHYLRTWYSDYGLPNRLWWLHSHRNKCIYCDVDLVMRNDEWDTLFCSSSDSSLCLASYFFCPINSSLWIYFMSTESLALLLCKHLSPDSHRHCSSMCCNTGIRQDVTPCQIKPVVNKSAACFSSTTEGFFLKCQGKRTHSCVAVLLLSFMCL